MVRRQPPAGKRREVIAHAWKAYHGQRLSFAELVRVLSSFRPPKP